MTNNQLRVLDHALVKHKITLLRDKNTSVKDFRALLQEIALFLAVEVSRDYPLKQSVVETPLERTIGWQLAAPGICLVPILRAGLGMVEGFLTVLPQAVVGHIGLERDEKTLKPKTYYCKLPPRVDEMTVIIVDPMLATGGSAVAAIDLLKQKGVKNIQLAAIIGAPEGVAAVEAAHPEVTVYMAQLDEGLNAKGYIVPGLGDAGDRIFGTLAK